MSASNWGDIYKELGAKPIINAIGSVTMLGGSTPYPEVVEAMERASSAWVPMMELEEKAGQAIAKRVNVPAAYITSGAGSALTLASAAVMAGDDDDKIQQLPDTTGMKNEILIQKRQRYWYDRCLELGGARLVDFGTDEGTTREDLEKAIGPNTAAVHYVANDEDPDPDALSGEETIEIAKAHGVPVIVDAAGQIYPLDLMGKYVRLGADIQCIAAKYMGAPQSTGLAIGSEDAIHKLGLQSFVSYEGRRVRGIGRPQKIDRQEIIGLVAAVDRWMSINHEERLADFETRSQTVIGLIEGTPGLKAELIENIVGHKAFGVNLTVDANVAGITAEDMVARLKEGDPSIWTRVGPEGDITLHMFALAEGEERVVGERIASLVTGS